MPLAPKQPVADVLPERKPRPRRLIIGDQTVPPGALQWSSPREQHDIHRRWARAVSYAIGSNSSRALRLAWLLQRLSSRHGYSFATDGFLSSETGIPVARVSDGLLDLERAGAIIRAHIPKGATTQRRIWLSRAVVDEHERSLRPGDTPTPRSRDERPPSVGGQNKKEGLARYSQLQNAGKAARLGSVHDEQGDGEEQARRFAQSSPIEVSGKAGAPVGARRPAPANVS